MTQVHEAEQLMMPLLVPVSGQPTTVRFDPFESEMLAHLKCKFGLSMSEIIKRSVRLVRVDEMLHGGSSDFLFNPDRLNFPNRVKPPTAGRPSRARKISQLEKTISVGLRALDAQRRELEALKQREARAA
jgi:hypothetical protein